MQKRKRILTLSLIAAVVGVSIMSVATAVLYRINQDNTGEFAATSAPPEASCISSSKACVGAGCWCGSQYGSATCVHNATCSGNWCSSINCSGTAQPNPTGAPQPTTAPTSAPTAPGRCGFGYSDGVCGGIKVKNVPSGGYCNLNQRACYSSGNGTGFCISDPLCIQTNPANPTPTAVCKSDNSVVTDASECCSKNIIYNNAVGNICIPAPTAAPTVVSSKPTATAAVPSVGVGTNDCGDSGLFADNGVCGSISAGCPNQLLCTYKGGGTRCRPVPDSRKAECSGPTPELTQDQTCSNYNGSTPRQGGRDGGCFMVDGVGKLVCTKNNDNYALDYSYCRTVGGPELPSSAVAQGANPSPTTQTTTNPITTDEPKLSDPLTGLPSAASIIFSNSLGTVLLLAFIIISSLFGITVLVYQALNKNNNN